MQKCRLILARNGYGAQIFDTAEGPQRIAQHLDNNHFQLVSQNSLGPEPSINARAHSVVEFCSRLGEACAQSISKGRLMVIGGDHACALGTWSGVTQGLAAKNNFGLIWIDAHLDSHTMETSPSKALHGMPVAALLGKGEANFVNAFSKGPHIDPRHLVFIGTRSYEPEETELLKGLGVKIFFMEEVQKIGLDAVLKQAIAIAEHGTMGFGISLDIDAIDPLYAPGVGSPEPNGLNPQELMAGLQVAFANPKLRAFEMVEYNPMRDINEQTLKIAVNIANAFQ